MADVLPHITVAAALELPELRRGLPEVVAAQDRLDRPLRWVHAGEVPNIASLLRGGEMLLTTGMGIGPRAADQRRFIAELAQRKVAALVIELGDTFKQHVPPPLVSAAEEHGMPLIELHASVQFVAVTEAIHTELINHQYESLRRAEQLHERFTELMLEGAGIPGVLSLLAEAVSNPVFLAAEDGRLLAYAGSPQTAPDMDLVAAWGQAHRQAEELGASTPVPTDAGHSVGRLVTLPLDGPLAGFAPLALKRASGIVALAFLRSQQERELLALGRGDFLSDVIRGRQPADVAEARARNLGFNNRSGDQLLPMAARLAPSINDSLPADLGESATGTMSASAWVRAVGHLERALDVLGAPTMLGINPAQDEVLMVIGVRDAQDRTQIADRVAGIVGEIAERRIGLSAVVAAGPLSKWAGIGHGLRDASEASAVGADLPARSWFDATKMPLDRLLWRLKDQGELRRYVESMLCPVLEHDSRRKHQLMPTLVALCQHGGRKAETARSLHLNRQALYDRIARLERVLGADLSDDQSLMSFQLALRASHYLGAPKE